ncbi:MAG TPA: hypothetical protein VG708_01345, partial [Mycobacteriales bacterium]|nr:hypothetical protein [Mycobacteriales bacterium]
APWLLVGGIALGCAIYLTWHLWAAPSRRVTAGNPNDSRLYVWYLQHAAWCVTHGHNPFVFTTMNAPAGINAMWNTSIIVPGVLLTPVTLLANASVSYDVLLVGGITVATVAAFALLRRFVRNDVAAAIGALLYGFSPAVVAAGIGHLSLAMTAAIPVVLLLVEQIVVGQRRPVVLGVVLGVVTAAQLLTGEEVLFQAGVAVVVVLVVAGLTAVRDVTWIRLRRLAVAGATALVVTLVLAGYPLWMQFFGRLQQHGSPFTTSYFETDLRGFYTPSGSYWLATQSSKHFAAAYGGGAPEYMAYLGIPVLVVAIITGLVGWRHQRVRLVFVAGLIAAVLSLGADLLVGGVHHDVWLPWRTLQQLPVFEAALANRFAILTALAAAALVAIALDWLLRHGRAAARVGFTAVVAAACLAPLVPKPYAALATPPVPDFFRDVTHWVPRGSTVLVVPFPTARKTEPLMWQAAADMAFRMPGGFFIGPAGTGQAYIGGPGLRPTAAELTDIAASGDAPPVTDQVRESFAADVHYWGVDAVALGPATYRAQLASFLTKLIGRTPTSAGGVLLWSGLGSTPTAP